MNKKRVLSFVAGVAMCVSLYAQFVGGVVYDSPESNTWMRTYYKQGYEVKGKVFGKDEFEQNPYPLQGANVKVTCMGDTTLMYLQSVGKDGWFDVWIGSRKRLKDTRLHVVISYVGMDPYDKIIEPEKTKQNGLDTYLFNADSLVMESKPMTLDEAVVVAELKKMYQRGDTIIFNADAYEMPSGSVLLDLVRRLPGLKYEGGKMTYLGRDIHEIKLNGESFFQRDMSIALNNMPTEKLKGLKVYEVPEDTLNVMSDKHLVMDMETKEPMLATIFSEATVGTTEKFNHYLFHGNFTSWRKKGAQINANLMTQDIPSEGTYQQKTISTYGSLVYTQDFGKMQVQAFGNHNYDHNDTKNDSYTKLFMPEYTQNSMSESTNSSIGKTWRGGGRVDGDVLKWSHWFVNVDFSKSDNTNNSQSVDSISNEGQGLVRMTRQVNTSDGTNKTVNALASFNLAFDGEHRNSIDFTYRYSHNDNENTSFNKSYSRFIQKGDSISDVNHRISTPSRGNRHNLEVSYSHRLGDYKSTNSYLRLSYELGVDKTTGTQDYADVLADGIYVPLDSLHYDKTHKTVGHTIGLSYMYDNKKIRLNVVTNLVPKSMTIDNDQYGKFEHIDYNGLEFLHYTNTTLKMGKNQLTLRYDGGNQLPGIEQLSNVTDYSDPMNIRMGNPNLKNAFNHNFSLEYQLTTLMRFSLSYGTTHNQFTTLTLLDKQTGVRRTSPANINGNWRTRENVYFTIPIHDFTLTLITSYNYNHSVSYVQSTTDNQAQKSTTHYHNFDANIDGSYGDKYWMIQTGLGYRLNHNKSDNTSTITKGQNLSAHTDIKYEAPCGLELGVKCQFNRPFGYEMAAANKTECMLNLRSEYHFLKRRLATLRIEWRDVLKSYNGFKSMMNNTMWQESRTYGDTSMFIISFRYRINAFD